MRRCTVDLLSVLCFCSCLGRVLLVGPGSAFSTRGFLGMREDEPGRWLVFGTDFRGRECGIFASAEKIFEAEKLTSGARTEEGRSRIWWKALPSQIAPPPHHVSKLRTWTSLRLRLDGTDNLETQWLKPCSHSTKPHASGQHRHRQRPTSSVEFSLQAKILRPASFQRLRSRLSPRKCQPRINREYENGTVHRHCKKTHAPHACHSQTVRSITGSPPRARSSGSGDSARARSSPCRSSPPPPAAAPCPRRRR